MKPDVPISSIRLSDRLRQLAHGSGPRCTSRSLRTHNFPNTIACEKLPLPSRNLDSRYDNPQRSFGQPQSSLCAETVPWGVHCCCVLLVRCFLFVSSVDGSLSRNPWVNRRQPRVAAILVLLASIAGIMAGCAPRDKRNPGIDDVVRKYEAWLKAQLPEPHYGVGTPKSSQEVVFITDLQAAPERGLSKVHLKTTQDRISYVYDRQVNRLINPVFSDGLAAVEVPIGRCAYIEESGRFAFAPIFRRANDFDGGVATAQLGPAARGRTPAPDGAWMLLDRSGSMKALDPSIAMVRGFSAGLAAFSTGDRLSGYIDRTGAIQIPATFALARPFCADGTAAVRTGSAWGLIDRHGSFVIGPNYDDIHCFSEGLAAAKSSKWGFIDKAGTFVVPPRFDGVGDFSEGLASFESRTWPRGSGLPYVSAYGFIDRTGSVVVPPTYTWTYPFKFGMAKAGTKQIDWLRYPLSYFVPADPHYTSWKYIDRRGTVVASGGRD